MADMVWHNGNAYAKTYHRIEDGDRRTVCGRPVGDVIDGIPARGALMRLADARAAGHRDCSRCFGHSQTRKPILDGRRNEP